MLRGTPCPGTLESLPTQRIIYSGVKITLTMRYAVREMCTGQKGWLPAGCAALACAQTTFAPERLCCLLPISNMTPSRRQPCTV